MSGIVVPISSLYQHFIMQKKFYLMAMAILTVIVISMSCTKTEVMGVTGPTGPQGPTGDANVFTDTFTVKSNEWAFGTYNFRWLIIAISKSFQDFMMQ